MSFDAFGLDESLTRAVEALGWHRPTPIQEQAIPAILSGGDLIGTARTGTGKTAAFLLPAMHRLLPKPRGTTRVLVLAPTRELASQIEEDLRELARFTKLRGAAVFGGVGYKHQVQALRTGADFIIATPGRLLDHMERGAARFDRLEVLVLDEADRMLDMGFMPDVRRIVRTLPRRRQTLLFSATMPPPIVSLAREAMREPIRRLDCNPEGAPAVGITHAVYPVVQGQKTELLLRLLEGQSMPSVLIFTRTRRHADVLARALERSGRRTELLHGERTQQQRTEALEAFRQGRVPVLVATDIAARGLDIEEISHVINYDVPPTPDDYVHRIGRTARAEARGDAFTLAAPEEEEALARIERRIGGSLPRVTLPDFPYRAAPPVIRRPDGSFVFTPIPGVTLPARRSGPPKFRRRRR
jgi:ATP-dependent RNA helicase RhlE